MRNFGILFALIALSACSIEFRPFPRETTNETSCFIKSRRLADLSAASCQSLDEYRFDMRRFSPAIQADGVSQASKCFEGSDCVSVDIQSFSTAGAASADNEAAQHPQAYNYTEYRVTRLDGQAKPLYFRSSDSSLEGALEKAIARCEELSQ